MKFRRIIYKERPNCSQKNSHLLWDYYSFFIIKFFVVSCLFLHIMHTFFILSLSITLFLYHSFFLLSLLIYSPRCFFVYPEHPTRTFSLALFSCFFCSFSFIFQFIFIHWYIKPPQFDMRPSFVNIQGIYFVDFFPTSVFCVKYLPRPLITINVSYYLIHNECH